MTLQSSIDETESILSKSKEHLFNDYERGSEDVYLSEESSDDENVALSKRSPAGWHVGLQVNPSENDVVSLNILYDTPSGTVEGGLRKESEDKSDKDIVLTDQDPSPDLDPLKASYKHTIPRTQWYKGVLLQGCIVNPNILMGLDDFEVREDDVFIITYPKSGTTWVEEMVSLIYNDGNINKVKNKLLGCRVKTLEAGKPIGHLQHLSKVKSPRLMGTHLPLTVIPQSIRQGKCKIIYVVRNPKDNAVSYYHYHKISTFLGNYKGSWDDFLYLFMKGYLIYGSWFDHVLPYWEFYQEHSERTLFISYEELKLDLPGMVSKIASFLDRPFSPDAIEAISNHCTFEATAWRTERFCRLPAYSI
ncbi:Sulfotransferase family cytosolic 1B member 1 like protein [Argiope bruennichi]|uniref:Sulfotransferase family cytosolic 1B member 1 like protein n=1 Tax=Argiope bruennichi TaxID=94029 RepID=A0A8T0E6W1_ARGBR|nr:Sulfotransferase family cytosolic 1B member 1 like protein [Argiope bruennichi]